MRVLGDRREAKRDLLALRSLERAVVSRRRGARLPWGRSERCSGRVRHRRRSLAPARRSFARSRFKRKLIGGDSVAPAEAIVEAVLGKALMESARRAKRPPPQARPAEASAEGDVAEEPEVVPAELTADQQIEVEPVRMLETYEHPAFLREALSSADDRLLIVSPWVRRSIVDKKFVAVLEERLQAGLTCSSVGG